jgi:hypothetical protein
MKSVFESKTVWMNALTALSVIFALPELHAVLGPNALVYVSLAQSLVNIMLRVFFTTEALTPTRPPQAGK